jgi:hypothetical protein
LLDGGYGTPALQVLAIRGNTKLIKGQQDFLCGWLKTFSEK